LKRVIVAYHNQIVMEETLEAAIARLFGGLGRPAAPVEAAAPAAASTAAAAAPAPEAASDATTLATRARGHYDRAIQAQREGNWALYGEEIRKLGEVLREMNRQR
jgi:uncharacterized membrane protein (UPF0182 family)